MYRIAVLVSLAILAGCTTQRLETRREVTQAALASYPGNAQRSPDVQVAAVDEAARKQIVLNNLTDTSVANPTVWVNGTYLKKIDSIPPRGQVTVRYADLIEAGRGVQDLATANNAVSKVELQTQNGLFTVLGPTRGK